MCSTISKTKQEGNCFMKSFGKYLAFILLSTVLVPGIANSVGTKRPTDQQITDWARKVLQQVPGIRSSVVRITARSGIVTLSGVVNTLAAKKFADRESKKIRGVLGVINEIIVSPVSLPDNQITQNVLRKLQSSADLNPAAITVRTVEGEVFLTGTVDSWTEREEAELLATEVSGVRSVIDELKVRYEKKRRDGDIQQDVISTLDRDAYLIGLPISVTVSHGVVTLKGSVTSLYEKDRARGDAVSVDNVNSVENQLQVVAGERNIRKTFPQPSDAQLVRGMREELSQDLRVEDPYKLDIAVINGNVTLRGLVSSYYQKHLAGEDVRNVVGVGWVANLLTVWAEWRDDRAIREDAQFAIDADSLLNSQGIRIQVAGGVVTLTGRADTFYQKLHAEEVVSRVRGVRDVVDTIRVKEAFFFSDAAIQDEVRRRLEANALSESVADRIGIRVERGHVTLVGDVDTWPEYREAARIVLLTEGVRDLDNRLTVTGH
jgi:osmotically-inducible protein OsmY